MYVTGYNMRMETGIHYYDLWELRRELARLYPQDTFSYLTKAGLASINKEGGIVISNDHGNIDGIPDEFPVTGYVSYEEEHGQIPEPWLVRFYSAIVRGYHRVLDPKYTINEVKSPFHNA